MMQAGGTYGRGRRAAHGPLRRRTGVEDGPEGARRGGRVAARTRAATLAQRRVEKATVSVQNPGGRPAWGRGAHGRREGHISAEVPRALHGHVRYVPGHSDFNFGGQPPGPPAHRQLGARALGGFALDVVPSVASIDR